MMAILAASTALLIALLSTNSSCSASSIRKQQEEAYEPPHIHCPDNEQFTDKEFTIAPAGTYEVIFYTNNYRKAWKLETDNNGKFMAPVLDIINTNVELNVGLLCCCSYHPTNKDFYIILKFFQTSGKRTQAEKEEQTVRTIETNTIQQQ